MNEKAFEKDPRNIVTLANRVYLFASLQRRSDTMLALEQLEKLKKCDDFDRLKDVALGELAYSYTRMGPRYYRQAIKYFRDVIERRPEMYLLKFGLALTYRRCLMGCIFSMKPTEDIDEAFKRAVQLLLDVIRNSPVSDLKGKSYILLGELYQMLDDCVYPLNPVIASTLDVDKPINTNECYSYAYNNSFVLQRAGKYFRKTGRYALAEELLKKAVDIRPSSTFAHYHLALVYKEMASLANSFSSVQNDSQLSLHDSLPGDELKGTYPKSCATAEIISVLGDGESVFGNLHIENPNSDDLEEGSYTYQELMKKIKYHLDKSVDISNESNTRAVYELGMFYMGLARHSEAEAQFRKLIQKGQPYASPLEKAQLGLLYRQKSEDEQCPETRRSEYQMECKAMLTMSIEEAAKAVVMVPGMETSEILDSWKALPTLEELLNSDKETEKTENIKKVARLKTLMCEYKGSLDLYTEILKQDVFDEDVLEGMITNYLNLQHFDNALLAVYLLQTTQTGHQGNRRRNFDKDVFLTIGMYFLEQDELEKAGECFRNSFRCAYPASPDQTLFDILILEDSEELQQTEGATLAQLLEDCGLKVTRNNQAVKPGSGSRHGRMQDYRHNLDCTTDVKTISTFLRCCGPAAFW